MFKVGPTKFNTPSQNQIFYGHAIPKKMEIRYVNRFQFGYVFSQKKPVDLQTILPCFWNVWLQLGIKLKY